MMMTVTTVHGKLGYDYVMYTRVTYDCCKWAIDEECVHFAAADY